MAQLIPYLSPGDVIIDGGNSDFHDTERRVKEMEAHGMYFVGTGISGGEIGALYGPSVMPGGSPAAWPLVKDVLQSIAAKLDRTGRLDCQWLVRWSRPFRENGTQWYRVWRYAVDFRGVFLIEESSGSGQ